MQIDVLADANHWNGDCFIVRGAGGNDAPVVFDIGRKSFASYVPPDIRIVVLSHDDGDHIGGAEEFFRTQCKLTSNHQAIQPELWVPYEWSWAYRALLGVAQDSSTSLGDDVKRIVAAHASDALTGATRSAHERRAVGNSSDRREQPDRQLDDGGGRHRTTLDGNVPESAARGADQSEEHVLLSGDRLVHGQGEINKLEGSGGEHQGESQQPPDISLWFDEALEIHRGNTVRPLTRYIVNFALDDLRKHDLPLVVDRRRSEVVRRTAESAARTATIITLAVRAGWRVRCFSYTAAQNVAGSPPYLNEGVAGDFTIINAREVQVSWTGLDNGALLMMAAGYLTVQNRRSLVGLASVAGDPRALFWADSSGAFICDSIMPPEFYGLFTAPHHGSRNQAHDSVWYWMRNNACPGWLVSTRNNNIHHLRRDFFDFDPHRRAATSCGTDRSHARTLHWSCCTGFAYGDVCGNHLCCRH